MAVLVYGGEPATLGDRVAELATRARPLEVLVTSDEAEMRSRLGEIEVAAGSVPMPILRDAPNLRWYQHWFAGVDRLVGDGSPASRGVVITNNSGVHAESMSEQIFGLLLSLARKLHVHRDNQQNRTWGKITMRDVYELEGRSLLVVGMGSIGRRVAELGRAFRMDVTGVTRSGRSDSGVAVIPPEELPEALPHADVVVALAPLTKETERMFDARLFSLMKPGSIFVNFGRGRLVDQEALITALRDGPLGGAALDVTDPEPLPADSPLWTLANVLITPHTSGFTPIYLERTWPIFMENLRRYHAGEPLQNVVDPQAGY